jgi:glycosyltransferase involved in cell wall biosynthesis
MTFGIIARCDNTGLGNQTRDLVRMLSPDRILLVNSAKFNNNKQYPEWYDGYNVTMTNGFPTKQEVAIFMDGLNSVLTCETFYHPHFINLAQRRKVKTLMQYNYEFLDHLNKPDMPLPTYMISPSYWKVDETIAKFGNDTKVVHIPPPIYLDDFKSARENNMSKDHKRILHIGGKAASQDRNGTQTVIDMLRHSKADYELVIRSQSELNINYKDSRLTVEIGNIDSRSEMYNGFDAMVMPRRYAGLCLPMNEALVSGLPVFMTDISPNNQILPSDWLISSSKVSTLMTRVKLDVYEADVKELAKKIDRYINSDKKLQKEKALTIGFENFDPSILKDQYLQILEG